jgi:hypothetical protein
VKWAATRDTKLVHDAGQSNRFSPQIYAEKRESETLLLIRIFLRNLRLNFTRSR